VETAVRRSDTTVNADAATQNSTTDEDLAPLTSVAGDPATSAVGPSVPATESTTTPDPTDTTVQAPDPTNAPALTAPLPTAPAPTTTPAPVPTNAPGPTVPADTSLPDPDDAPLNEQGVPILLDEAGILACANAQFARDALDFGDVNAAATNLETGANRAEPSAVAPIAEAADSLRNALAESQPRNVINAFLGICETYGHQL